MQQRLSMRIYCELPSIDMSDADAHGTFFEIHRRVSVLLKEIQLYGKLPEGTVLSLDRGWEDSKDDTNRVTPEGKDI